jgi:TonB family protein
MLIGVAVAGACGSTVFVPPPPSPQRVYGVTEVDQRPEIVQTPPLHYPEGGREGVVVVRVVIDTAGNPEPATALVVQGSDSVLAAAARRLVLNTLFRAARVRGQVVRTLVEVPVEFSVASAAPTIKMHIAGDVYSEADVEERPHLMSGPPLAYPAPMLLSRISGRVIIEAVIDTTGRVEDGTVRVLESSDARFNEAAKNYVRAARFTPGRLAGSAVRVRFEMPVEFKPPTRN